MEKSIESIWKEGFLKSDALVAPKLNDLYDRKSQHVVDKLMSRGKTNLKWIMIGAFIVLVASILLNTIPAGIFLFLILTWLVFYSKKQGKKIYEIDKTLSSYEYLKAVDNSLKERIASYIKIHRVLYPAIILSFAVGFWFSDIGQKGIARAIAEKPEASLLFGVPMEMWVFVIGFSALMSIFAGPIYKFDIRLVYGSIFQKLKDMLADMEELRA